MARIVKSLPKSASYQYTMNDGGNLYYSTRFVYVYYKGLYADGDESIRRYTVKEWDNK